MNKIIFFLCLMIGGFFGYAGITTNAQIKDLYRQNMDTKADNDHMEQEILIKQSLSQKPPVELSKAFSLVINEIHFLEDYSGTTMNLSITNSKDNDDISNYFIESQYQGVKKLPVTIQVDKFSNETDMAAVLSDIHQLEWETDFKVTEINMDDNTLNVKGDIYGL